MSAEDDVRRAFRKLIADIDQQIAGKEAQRKQLTDDIRELKKARTKHQKALQGLNDSVPASDQSSVEHSDDAAATVLNEQIR